MSTIELLRLTAMIALLILMVAGLSLAWLALAGRQRMRELAYQERIAMIEKGLIPSPETDPAGFEAMLAPRRPSEKAILFRTAGVIITGLGLSMMLLLFFVVPQIRGIAIGVGGAVTVIGLTIVANAILLSGDGGESNGRNMTRRG